MGRIQKTDPQTRCEFLGLCCVYWSAQGHLSLEDAQLEVKEWSEMIRLRVVQVEDGFISISFLDEQLSHVKDVVAKRSKAGKKGRNKQLGQLPSISPALDGQVFNKTGQIRLDKIRDIKRGDLQGSGFTDLKNQMLESVSQHELLARRHSIQPVNVLKYLNTFMMDQELAWEDEDPRTIKDLWTHLNNWIRTKEEKQAKESRNQPSLNDFLSLAAGA